MNFGDIVTIESRATDELDYISYCLEFIGKEIKIKSNKSKKSYEKKLHNEEVNIDNIIYYDDISITILNSIIVRQIAIVEKFFVELSFDVYEKITNKKHQIIPPNYNIKRNFSCSTKAAKFINDTLKIDINGTSDNWKIFKVVREKVRHKLAHGESEFILKNEEASDINKKFNNDLLVKYRDKYIEEGEHDFNENFKKNKSKDDCVTKDNNNSFFRISSDFSILVELNKKLKNLVKESSKSVNKEIKNLTRHST